MCRFGGMITVHFVQEWVGGATINLVELSNLFIFTSPVFLSQSYPMLVTAATVRASYTIFYCILCIDLHTVNMLFVIRPFQISFTIEEHQV